MWSLSTAPSAGSPCDPSEWDPLLSSVFCQEEEETSKIKCLASRAPFRSSSLVCGRTCTAPVCRAITFSVPLFSQRLIYGLWRLQWFRQPRPSHLVYVYNREGETFAYKNNNNNIWSHLWGTSIILTWELLWLPAALSIVRHSAVKQTNGVIPTQSQSGIQYVTEQKNWEIIMLDFLHLLWKPIRWTPRLRERFYSPTYRHPGRHREKASK